MIPTATSPSRHTTRHGPGRVDADGGVNDEAIESGRAGGDGHSSWTATVIAAWVVSRIVAISALTVGGATTGRVSWGALTDWDAGWFLAIVEHGYGREPIPVRWTPNNWSRWPFFPLHPALTRVVMLTGVSSKVAIVAVNNITFLVALAGLYRLASRHLGRETARWAVWALALFPGSITSVMGYSGGLFLAGSVWAFAFIDEDSFTLAGLAALVAVAARPNGALVLLALIPATVTATRRTGSSLRSAVQVNLPAVVFLVGWCAWLYRATGDPLVFLHAKAAWFEMTIIEFVHRPNGSSLTHVLLAAIAATALIWQRRRLPASWKVLALVTLAPSLLLGVIGLGRYSAECFPVSIALGMMLQSVARWLRALYLTMSTVGLIAMGILIHHARLVP